MQNKLFILVVALAMVVSLTACGGNANTASNISSSIPVSSQEQMLSSAPSSEVSSEPEPEQSSEPELEVKPYLDEIGANFSIESGTPYIQQVWASQTGYQDVTANVDVADATAQGEGNIAKKITVTLTDVPSGNYLFDAGVLDYYTGAVADLGSNKLGENLYNADASYTAMVNGQEYTAWVAVDHAGSNSSVTLVFTVEYPKDYDGLCLFVSSYPKSTEDIHPFMNGENGLEIFSPVNGFEMENIHFIRAN